VTAAIAALMLGATLLATAGSTVATAQTSLTVTSLGTVPSPVKNGKNALYAWGAATLPDGSVAIGDIWNARVVRYSPTGANLGQLFKLPSGENPYGLAVDPRDWTIYVGGSSCCWVYSYERNPTTGVYTQGPTITNNNFKYPSRMTVRDDGWVYIADMLQGQVFVYDAGLNFRFTIATKGSANGQLRQPRAMAFDDQGRLFVVDAFNFRVSVFSETGTFLYKFGSQGTNPGQFQGSDIRGLSLDRANGWVYVVDGNSGYINKYALDGTYLTRFGGIGGRQGVTVCCQTPLGKFHDGGRESALDGNGNLWVGDMPSFRAQVFTPTGASAFQVPSPDVFPNPGGFNYPQGVAVDKDGNVIVSDTRNFRIQKFNASGVFTWQLGLRGRFSGYSLNYARGVDTDPRDGSILVADNFSSQIKKFTADGVHLWTAGGAGKGNGQIDHPSQAAVGPDGTIYVADSWNDRIAVFSQNGTWIRNIVSSTGFLMKDPRGVTVDQSNGDLYVSDWAGKAVYRLRNDGTYVSTFGRDSSLGGLITSASQSAVDANYLYVADTPSLQVKVYDKSTRQYLGSITGLKGPHAVSVAPNGTIVVAELYAGKVSRWRVS
jgi:sugar lactone lactonase YvrE